MRSRSVSLFCVLPAHVLCLVVSHISILNCTERNMMEPDCNHYVFRD